MSASVQIRSTATLYLQHQGGVFWPPAHDRRGRHVRNLFHASRAWLEGGLDAVVAAAPKSVIRVPLYEAHMFLCVRCPCVGMVMKVLLNFRSNEGLARLTFETIGTVGLLHLLPCVFLIAGPTEPRASHKAQERWRGAARLSVEML